MGVRLEFDFFNYGAGVEVCSVCVCACARACVCACVCARAHNCHSDPYQLIIAVERERLSINAVLLMIIIEFIIRSVVLPPQHEGP